VKKRVVIEIDSDWFDIVEDAVRLIRRICNARNVPVKIKVGVVDESSS